MSNRVEHLAEGVTLYMGDCREILPTLDRFDAVVTDPPYGINITKSNRLAVSRGMGGGSWDAAPIDAATVQMVVGAADQAIVWGGNYFELPPARCFLIWDKQNDGRDFADIEMAWTNIDAVARIKRLRPMNMDGGKVHPTQKPVDLMKWCLGLVSGRVLDPFMGSGSTGVACVKTGKAFVASNAKKNTSTLPAAGSLMRSPAQTCSSRRPPSQLRRRCYDLLAPLRSPRRRSGF